MDSKITAIWDRWTCHSKTAKPHYPAAITASTILGMHSTRFCNLAEGRAVSTTEDPRGGMYCNNDPPFQTPVFVKRLFKDRTLSHSILLGMFPWDNDNPRKRKSSSLKPFHLWRWNNSIKAEHKSHIWCVYLVYQSHTHTFSPVVLLEVIKIILSGSFQTVHLSVWALHHVWQQLDDLDLVWDVGRCLFDLFLLVMNLFSLQ